VALDCDLSRTHILNMFKTPAVAARRAASATAGILLVAGMAVLTVSAFMGVTHAIARVSPYTILGATWLAAIVGGALAYVTVRASGRLSARPLEASGAFVLVSIGAALVLPLTLHGIAMHTTADRFRDWVQMSLVITSTAHVAFAGMVGIRASKLANGEPAQSAWSIYVWTIGVSAFPFAILWGLPPLLVAFTGLFIVPAVRAMERYAAYDRSAITVPYARAF
jgi:hypothetical protein